MSFQTHRFVRHQRKAMLFFGTDEGCYDLMIDKYYSYTIMFSREVTLPSWLDDYIFSDLGAKYCRSNSDMMVIDWGPTEILNYLGTYSPRSYSESYCIFKQFLLNHKVFNDANSMKLLDFGCGTGGEIIGFATALSDCRPNIKTLIVKAIDGNQYALKCFEGVKNKFNEHNVLQIESNPSAIKIDDFYDLSVMDAILEDSFDVVISFKAVCEFVTKQQFKEKNAYEHLAKFMIPRLKEGGVMLLVDITSKNSVVQEWLPNLMDKGLRDANAPIIEKNLAHSETFVVNHSRQIRDISKVAWRIISIKNQEI